MSHGAAQRIVLTATKQARKKTLQGCEFRGILRPKEPALKQSIFLVKIMLPATRQLTQRTWRKYHLQILA